MESLVKRCTCISLRYKFHPRVCVHQTPDQYKQHPATQTHRSTAGRYILVIFNFYQSFRPRLWKFRDKRVIKRLPKFLCQLWTLNRWPPGWKSETRGIIDHCCPLHNILILVWKDKTMRLQDQNVVALQGQTGKTLCKQFDQLTVADMSIIQVFCCMPEQTRWNTSQGFQ